MANRAIDYDALLRNINEMINTLEYDAMRSAGKAKMSAATLRDLHDLKKHYEAGKKPVKKQAPTKEA